MKKNRFILMNGETKVGEAPSIKTLAPLVGCTFQHIYQTINEDKTSFTYKKIKYRIIDKLDITTCFVTTTDLN
jgi:hypothetical protein